jgi:hypothetical protein
MILAGKKEAVMLRRIQTTRKIGKNFIVRRVNMDSIAPPRARRVKKLSIQKTQNPA